MRLVGFNFTKINVERFSEKAEKVKINTNIDLIGLKEAKSNIFNLKETILGIKFIYKISYEPHLANLDLGGSLLISTDPNSAKEILKQWNDKKLPEKFKINLFNIILRKSNIKALQLEDEMNLPAHFSLPTLREPETEEKK